MKISVLRTIAKTKLLYRNIRSAIRASLSVTQGSSDTRHRWKDARIERPSQTFTEFDRKKLMAQSRLESRENPHCMGMVNGLVRGAIGQGAKIQICTDDDLFNNHVENLWSEYSHFSQFSESVRQAVWSLIVNGEAFVQWAYNPHNPVWPIHPELLDPFRIDSPAGIVDTKEMREGIRYDQYLYPVEYFVLRLPEYATSFYNAADGEWLPSDQIVHLFEKVFPEQERGYSWLMSSLETLGRMRDYEDAALEQAKIAASIVATISPKYGFGGETNIAYPEKYDYYCGEGMPVKRNTFIQLPPETTFNSFTPGQPISSHEAFIKTEATNAGFGLGLPRSKATGSTAEYNFASGKLDDRPFEILTKIIQEKVEYQLYHVAIKNMYLWNLPEILERFPQAPEPKYLPRKLCWQQQTPIDPHKAALADDIRIKNGTALRKDIIERDGGNFSYFQKQYEVERAIFGIPEIPTPEMPPIPLDDAETKGEEP